MQSADTLRGGRGSFALVLLLAAAMVAGTALTVTLIDWSIAFFTNQQHNGNDIGTALIFRDERSTPAFSVTDRSSGSAVDRSAPFAFASDGRWLVSRAWPTTASASRYLDAELNGPLPAGLSVSGATLSLGIASDAAGATTCFWVELRRISSGALVSSHGSSGSPTACVTGTSFATSTISLSAVGGTDIANDLRVRVFATNSAAGNARIDRLTVEGSTPHANFALYPVLTRDVNGSDVQQIPWELAGE
jgi:hypothetical protein